MSRGQKFFTIIIGSAGCWLSANPVLALQLIPACARESGDCTICEILVMAMDWANVLASLVGGIALIMFIVGGVMWIFAGVSETMIEKGKKIIFGTLTGLAIMLFAWVAVNFIIHALSGADIKSVKIFSKSWWTPECTAEYPTSCDNKSIGTVCRDQYHVCYRVATDGATGSTCNSTTPCTCVSGCDYYEQSFVEQGTTATGTCVSADSGCPTGATDVGDSNACGEDQKCCLAVTE